MALVETADGLAFLWVRDCAVDRRALNLVTDELSPALRRAWLVGYQTAEKSPLSPGGSGPSRCFCARILARMKEEQEWSLRSIDASAISNGIACSRARLAGHLLRLWQVRKGKGLETRWGRSLLLQVRRPKKARPQRHFGTVAELEASQATRCCLVLGSS